MKSTLRYSTTLLSVAIALLLTSADVWGRPGITVNSYMTYTDNLFQNFSRRSDWITLTYFEVNQAIGRSMGVYYTGNASVFAEFEDLFTHRHEVGLKYYKPQGGRNGLYSGVLVRARLDRPVYRYYDSVEGEGYIQRKRYLRPSLLSWIGVRSKWRHYYNAPDYSYVENSLNVRLSRFLVSRTTLEFRLNAGAKSYVRSEFEDLLENDARSRSRGSRHLTQMSAAGKVAQTLGRGLGVQVEYLWQFNVSGRNRYTEVEAYNSDEELFDDDYSYDQRGVSITMKKVSTRGNWIKVSGGRQARAYLGRPALDLSGIPVDGDQTRRDTRWRASFGAGYTVPLGGIIKQMRLEGQLAYRNVSSNDPYYDAASRLYSVGVSGTF